MWGSIYISSKFNSIKSTAKTNSAEDLGIHTATIFQYFTLTWSQAASVYWKPISRWNDLAFSGNVWSERCPLCTFWEPYMEITLAQRVQKSNLLKNRQTMRKNTLLVWTIMHNAAMLRDTTTQAKLSMSQPIFCLVSFEIQVLFPKRSNQVRMFATSSLNKAQQHHFQNKTQHSPPLWFSTIVGKVETIPSYVFWAVWDTCITGLPKVQIISPYPLFSE